MILKLNMQHWELKFDKVYINDGSWLTMTYFTGRSNLVVNAFEWGKLLQSLTFNGERKHAANDQIDRKFMFLKTVDLRGMSSSCPGAIYMYMTIIFQHYLL